MAGGIQTGLFNRPATLRLHLIKLVLAGLAPLLIFSAGLILLFERQEQATLTRGLQETVRALRGALQLTFQSSITTLEALASSESLDAGAVVQFRGIAARVLGGQDDWAAVALFDTAGRQIFASFKSG